MKEHHFEIEDANKYGVEKAIILYNITFWLDKNKANHRNIHRYKDDNDYYWTFNSAASFAKMFTYFNARSISRWIKEMDDEGVLLRASFNRHKYDKMSWYSTPQYIVTPRQNDEGFRQNDEGFRQNDQPIPDNKQQIIKADVSYKSEVPSQHENGNDVNSILSIFYQHNKMFNFGHRGYRATLEKMIRLYGMENTIGFAEAAMAVQGQPFAPVISNPTELASKLGKLKDFYIREKQIQLKEDAKPLMVANI